MVTDTILLSSRSLFPRAKSLRHIRSHPALHGAHRINQPHNNKIERKHIERKNCPLQPAGFQTRLNGGICYNRSPLGPAPLQKLHISFSALLLHGVCLCKPWQPACVSTPLIARTPWGRYPGSRPIQNGNQGRNCYNR